MRFHIILITLLCRHWCFHGINAMILMQQQIVEAIANKNLHDKRKELDSLFHCQCQHPVWLPKSPISNLKISFLNIMQLYSHVQCTLMLECETVNGIDSYFENFVKISL